MATSSQKFIQRNRAPRVQIEYDVELYGAEKKVQLPFVMGVMSDLSGNPTEPLAAGRRSQVPRHLRRQLRRSPEGDEAARGLPGSQHADRRRQHQRRPLLREHGRLLARGHRAQGRRAQPSSCRRATSLSNLVTYMDGKTGAEDLIAKLLKDPALLQALAAAPNPDAGGRRSGEPSSSEEEPWLRHKKPAAGRLRNAWRSNEFASLLNKEFKPQTDEREERGRDTRCTTLAAAGAGQHQAHLERRRARPSRR